MRTTLHRFFLFLLLSGATQAGFAAGQTSLTKSNSAAGTDLGVGASSVVREEIQLLADGAVADYGLQKVFFPAEITEAPLTIITADGRKLACRATFLAVHDAASGSSIMLGQVTNSIGVLFGDNTVVYPKAFGSLGDLRFRYTKYSLEQDILLHEAVKLPAGLQPENMTLEVWSEWFGSTPDTKESQMIDLRPLAAAGTQAGVAASDEGLKFGASRIGEGFAFGMQSESAKTPVAKNFARIEGRDWLIERVDYTALKPLLDKLPKPQASLTPENLKPDRSELIRSLPARTRVKTSGKLMRLAKAGPADRNSVVLDFVIVSSVPVPADVVSWWPAGGNANDAIAASGNHGSWSGTAAYGAGKVGQAFSLGGVNNAVTVADAASLNFGEAQDFSLETWIKPLTNSNPTGSMSIFGKRQPTDPGYELYLTNGALGVRIGDSAYGATNYVVAGNLRDGAFHHVAVTVARSVTNGLKLYVDGVATAFDPTGYPGDLSNSEPLRIGVYPNGGTNCFFKGIIDEPAIYSRALSGSEIQGIYGAGVAGKNNPNCVVAPANLAAWWPGDGSTNDLAGTNPATLSGATYESAVASQGFSFNGTSAGVTAANDNALNLATTNDNVSLEAWIKPLANSTTYGVMSVIGKRYTPNISTATGYEMYLVNGAPGLQIARGTSIASFTATNDLRDGGFHHVVATLDRRATNGGHIYVDGVPKLTFNPTVVAGSLSNSAPVRIGVHPQPGFNGWYKGVIDEASIYRRALDSTEVSQLYAAGGAGKCKDDLDYDGLPDWWELKYFGNLDQGPNDDYDGDGVSNLDEFNAGSDPNMIAFQTYFTNDYVNASVFTGTIEVSGGVPAKMAVLVNSTNFASATWSAFYTNFSAVLGATNGNYEVWVGLRGLAEDSEQTWALSSVQRDTVAPLIVITNPVSNTTSRPIIQLQGYSPEPLSGIQFDLTNALGNFTNLEGFVTAQDYDTNGLVFTTNWFECLDVPLTNGENRVTLRVTDLAGNVTTTNLTYTLDYSGDTTAPLINLYWPQEGTQIAAASFTVRGWLDDPTAVVTAQIVDSSGATNEVSGIVERNGLLWVEELPLASGSNLLTLTTTDAAGNSSTTNLTLIKNNVEVAINEIPNVDMNTLAVSVGGTINVSDRTVWVNGVKATLDGNNWSAANVPLPNGGTAMVQARAILNTDNNGNGSGGGGGNAGSYADPGNPQSATAADGELAFDKQPAIWIARCDYYYYGSAVSGQNSSVGKIRIPWIRTNETHGTYQYIGHEPGLDWEFLTKYTWPPCAYELGCAEGVWTNTSTVNGVTTEASGTGVQPPVVVMWYCKDSAWRSYRSGGIDYREAETVIGRSEVKLHTGGKARPTRQNLFSVSASAEEQMNLWGTATRPIPATLLTVGVLGKLGSDGYLFKVLPDNQTYDVTIRAPRKNYSFNVGATKHKLRIIVNGTCPLSEGSVGSCAKFCVGQRIDFDGQMSPSIDEHLTSLQPEWTLNPLFVNMVNNGIAYCRYYVIDYSLLLQRQTHAWWVLGGPKKIVTKWDMVFKNGQKASVSVKGQLDMHRPKVVEFEPLRPPYFAFINTNKSWPPGRAWLQNGEDDGNMTGSMAFTCKVQIDSKFSGKANWTQLVKHFFSRDELPPVWVYILSTSGEWWLDNTEFYMQNDVDVIPPVSWEIPFGDAPGWPVGLTWCSMDAQFRTYLRFLPTGPDSIWITLGRVDWQFQAEAQLGANWSITSQYVPLPKLNDDEAFPFWSNIRNNY